MGSWDSRSLFLFVLRCVVCVFLKNWICSERKQSQGGSFLESPILSWVTSHLELPVLSWVGLLREQSWRRGVEYKHSPSGDPKRNQWGK